MVTLVLQARAPDAELLAHLKDGWPPVDALLATASERTGLDDFGDPAFTAGLARLLQSLDEDAQLDEPSRIGVLDVLVRRLVSRLRVQAWHKDHPGAADIKDPIMITGLPRTGTTALANMMSLDPQFRSLPPWEQIDPWYTEFAGDKDNDPRRIATIERQTSFVAANPDQMAMHLYEIDATEEDHDIIGLGFLAQHNTLPVGGYRTWWRYADARPAYAFHKKALQILQAHHTPRPWLLKAPHYKFHMPDIADVYPDVRYVFTHRDPVKTLPSYISFVTHFYPPGTVDRIGMPTIANEIYTHLLDGMRNAMKARDTLGDARFVDISQNALNRDPIAALEATYDGLKLPFTDSYADAVRAYSNTNATGAHGSHKYTPEQFGLTPERIRADFAFYTDRFGDLLA
ncbi:sulfotransferase family protein [Sphingomonas crocodyli]|uniref:Sulfotransferase n=1 Tax=Sphingomonas crocodyli TaxID=1979270 RepID=A0A437M6B9_9SPHN|nr:sulfotransferase [Sphingomonas crocodyli]RVT93197.1 sulfotransferase [Sphingomonas crocodyli]